MVTSVQLSRDVLNAVREVAERHGVHDINMSNQAIVRLVDATTRTAMALAIAADPKVTSVLGHVGDDGKVVVSVRRGKHDWQEVVVDD